MSRRSRDRAGLRYQRRGVDDDAHVANFVETETVMRLEVSFWIFIFQYIVTCLTIVTARGRVKRLQLCPDPWLECVTYYQYGNGTA